MADLLGTTVAANYRKASPSSMFGTPDLKFYSVSVANVHTNYANSNSLFFKCVNGVQRHNEVYFVGTPSSGAFVVAIRDNTSPDSANTGDTSPTVAERMKADIEAANGSVTATVAVLTASGASIA